MTVLMSADAVGGVWPYAMDLARGLTGRGVSVVLAVLGPPPSPAQRAAAARVAGLKLVETQLPLEWTAESPAEVTKAAEALAKLAREEGADLVHLNAPAFAAAAMFPAPVVAVQHSCVRTWWEAVRGGPLPEDFQWRGELIRQGLEAADAVVAPSLAFARATAAAYRLAATPKVVWNGRVAPATAAEPPAEPEDIVFTAGRLWDEGKNVATLDVVAGRIVHPFYAAGPLDGPNGAAFRGSGLRVLGQLDEAALGPWLAQRPVFVSAALYEPFGLAVLEAAQRGSALVLSDIPTFRELWDNAAVFVPPRDPDVIASAIRRLFAEPERRARLGQAARERAGRYGVDAMVDGMLRVYRAVATTGGSREAAA
jgi:glycosyltransferase involved in cell wall biosynthesis